MIIKKMAACFGRLQNETLELSPGLNLLEGPNEAGKSTWSAFLRAMLYGVPTRERDRQGYLAEKNRYQPWSGAAMEGRMDLIWQGREISLRRGPKGAAPFGKFEAVYADSGEAVPGLTGENAGELLLGVPREVFERSAFVGQGGAAIDAAPALEKRIAALVSSGEEEVSCSETQRRLKDWLNRRRHNRTGLIPKLEGELEVLDDTLARQSRAHRQAEDARRDIEALSAERKELQAALDAHRCAENRERRRRYEEARSALEAAEAEAGAVHAELTRHGAPPGREALRAAQEDLGYLNTLHANIKLAESQIEGARREAEYARREAADPLFPDMAPAQAREQAARDEAEVTRLQREAERQGKRFLRWLPFGFLGGGAAAAAGYALARPDFVVTSVAAGVAVFLVIECMAVVTGSLSRKKALQKAALLLERYAAQFPQDIPRRAEAFAEKCVLADEAAHRAQAVEASLAQLTQQRDELQGRLLALVHTFAPTVRDTFGVSAALSRALALDEKYAAALVRLEGARKLAESLPPPAALPDGDGPPPDTPPQVCAARLAAVEGELSRLRSVLAMAQGELSTLGDPALFQARRDALCEALERRRAEYAALELALDTLEQANGDLQARFSPALNRRAGEILSALTGGKYESITLSRDFEAAAEEAGGVLPRRALALSQGTADQLYLAVRLAVCDLALPSEEPAPLVLDDALANFDDGRMALALDYLLELGRARQILLFTCHSRERAYLERRPDAACIQLN